MHVFGLIPENFRDLTLAIPKNGGAIHFSSISYLPTPFSLHEPGHEKMCLIPYANNKDADQPAHPRSKLISVFVVRCQDGMIPLVYISEISRF